MTCYYQVPDGKYYILVTGEGTGGWVCNGVGGFSEPGSTWSCNTNSYTFGTINTSTITLSNPVATYTATGTSGDCNIIFTFASGDDSAVTEFTMYGWCYPQVVHLSTNGSEVLAPNLETNLFQLNGSYLPIWSASNISNPGNPAHDPLPYVNYYYGNSVYIQGTEGASDDINNPDGGNLCGGTQIYTLGPAIATITPVSGGTFAAAAFNPLFAMPGDVITIYGSGFTGTTTVSFNGTPTGTFTVRSDGVITAVVPSGVTPGPITVYTPTGNLTTEQALFTTTVIPGPAIWHYNNG